MSSEPPNSESVDQDFAEDGVVEQLILTTGGKQEVLIEEPNDISTHEDPTADSEDPSFTREPIPEDAVETTMETEESSEVPLNSEAEPKEGTRTKRSYRRGSTFDPNILSHILEQQKTTKSRRYAQKYRTQWEEMFYWCRRSKKSDLLFYCSLCRQDYFGGISELTRHAVTKKHEKNVQLVSPRLVKKLVELS